MKSGTSATTCIAILCCTRTNNSARLHDGRIASSSIFPSIQFTEPSHVWRRQVFRTHRYTLVPLVLSAGSVSTARPPCTLARQALRHFCYKVQQWFAKLSQAQRERVRTSSAVNNLTRPSPRRLLACAVVRRAHELGGRRKINCREFVMKRQNMPPKQHKTLLCPNSNAHQVHYLTYRTMLKHDAMKPLTTRRRPP